MNLRYMLLIVLLACSAALQAQSLRKYAIGNSGCSVYTFCPATYDMTLSEDSSEVYSGECRFGDVSYGTICVRLQEPPDNMKTAEELLLSYMDFLKSSFSIVKAAGYGMGHRLNDKENTRGALDYWEDNEGNNWKVKGWTDGRYIGVLYAWSGQALPEQKVNIFLDSFRLPE